MFENLFQKYITGKNVIFFVIAILFLIFLSQIQDIVVMFFASFVLACSMEPFVQKLSTKYKRSTAANIVLGSALLLILVFFVPLIVIAGREIVNFAISFPQYMDSIKEFILSLPLVNHANLNQIDIGGVLSSATDVTTKIFSETISVGMNLGSCLVYILASIIIIYYFMADKELIRKTCIKMFPVQMRERTGEIYDTIAKKIGGYVIAQITTMLSVGVIMTIGLLILRVDFALLLGLITCILDIIPVVGPAIALVICLIATYKAGWGVFLGVIVVFAITQLTENNFVRPYVFGKFLNIHPLIIYLFLFITAKYLGVIGVVFAPAIAATAVVLIEEVYMKNVE